MAYGEGNDERYDTGNDDSSTRRGSSKLGRAAAGAGRELNKAGTQMALNSAQNLQTQRSSEDPRYTDVPSFKRGGVVRKTGLIRAHKGERVIPAKKVKSLRSTKKIRGVKRIKRAKRGRE